MPRWNASDCILRTPVSKGDNLHLRGCRAVLTGSQSRMLHIPATHCDTPDSTLEDMRAIVELGHWFAGLQENWKVP
jgi:hypothetical protein